MSDFGKDSEWDTLVRDWKANDAPSPGLAKRVKHGTRKAYAGIALGIVAMAGIAAASVPELVRQGASPLFYTVDVYSLIMGLAITVVTIRALLGTLRPEAQTTRAYLELEKRRSEVEIRATRWIRGMVLVMLAFNALWAPWKLYVDRASYAAQPWRLVVGFGFEGVCLAVLWILSKLARRRHTKRVAMLDELLRAAAED
jgi:ribosomal protein L30/L7E